MKLYSLVVPDTLRDEYIKALPYIVIEDVNKYKTESQQLKEENKHLKQREDKLKSIMERLERLEQMLQTECTVNML